MDNQHLHQPDWEKVLAVLNHELPESTALNAEELELLAELKEIRDASRMYSDIEFDSESKIRSVKQRLNFTEPTKSKTIRLWPRIAIAAAAIAFIANGIYFFSYKNNQNLTTKTENFASVIKPGHNAATLTLANGKKIILSDAMNGELAKEAGVSITKTADGQVVYDITGTDNSEGGAINTLSTAKGETYVLTMPDKTTVWLNAASTIKYPANFTALKERRVTLSGEAYFQVAKDKDHPFFVETDKQSIKVLGTHFNVNSYSDEPTTKTTLLEGSVQINNERILKPGEQSILSPGGKIAVEEVDVNEAVAWKNGKFVFEYEPIDGVMRKLARWYDAEIIYQGDFKGKTFSGSISRFDNISKILDKITFTQDVHFKIEGRRITVMP